MSNVTHYVIVDREKGYFEQVTVCGIVVKQLVDDPNAFIETNRDYNVMQDVDCQACNPPPTPMQLVDAYDEASEALSEHYQYCPDQREQYGCDECTRLHERKYTRQKAVKENPEAVAIDRSPQRAEIRHIAARDYLNRHAANFDREDY